MVEFDLEHDGTSVLAPSSEMHLNMKALHDLLKAGLVDKQQFVWDVTEGCDSARVLRLTQIANLSFNP